VTDEPETFLYSWRVYKVQARVEGDPETIHFVGGIGRGEGRVSSCIMKYDAVTKRGVSASGRIYGLTFGSGSDPDGQYVWGRWLSINGNPKYENVTGEY